ncbi:IS3 family transposase [Streptomyces hazeniae]|uniref:IS3 family transposase n=1 Tax=Streptomyces hazeniae TaxID=3075538 RepID=UPI00374DFC29
MLNQRTGRVFFSTLKNEFIDRQHWPSRTAAHIAILEWIESWYNLHQLPSSLNYRNLAKETALVA